MNRIDKDGIRLLKKQIRPERAQSIAYGDAIRLGSNGHISPERALSIRCQAFSLMNGVVDVLVWRCHTLLILAPLRGLRGWIIKTTTVPQGRHFINRRWFFPLWGNQRGSSTDKTPPQHRIPSGMQPDSPFVGNAHFEQQIPPASYLAVRNDTQLVFRKGKSEDVGDVIANVFAFPPIFKNARHSEGAKRLRNLYQIRNKNIEIL